eukprot:TRINITY_DN349_c0_g1_i11.p1 TRINITY_DN349_c0_g1~~TRINITY_DN349_c0_g1_i11.p1  ORF type:complete len:155 (+),score=21.90 TRINITY_DN349_c0_g1_i11:686-1150(+)
MGQLNMMARYPLHFHMGYSRPNNFVQDCVIVSSNFRCITIHTNDTLVTRNVAYNTLGSCIYLEDGVEENNEISFNLIVHTRTIGKAAEGGFQPEESFDSTGFTVQPSDHAAAGIYYKRVELMLFQVVDWVLLSESIQCSWGECWPSKICGVCTK